MVAILTCDGYLLMRRVDVVMEQSQPCYFKAPLKLRPVLVHRCHFTLVVYPLSVKVTMPALQKAPLIYFPPRASEQQDSYPGARGPPILYKRRVSRAMFEVGYVVVNSWSRKVEGFCCEICSESGLRLMAIITRLVSTSSAPLCDGKICIR